VSIRPGTAACSDRSPGPDCTFGGRFGDAFDPESVVLEDWGMVTFQFGECNDASYTWEAPAPYDTGGFELIRLPALKNIFC